MCGICGIALEDRERPIDTGTLERMCELLAHRGPDDQGVVVRGGVGLGHRRLSIVDVAGGHQPMANEDGSVWVSFNGEIYNHRDFHPALTAAGHVYRTRSDTECLIHLYEQYGWEFVRRLRGIFAFALWDERRRVLLLARDAMGVKPLYYARTRAGDLVFASEVKALLACVPDAGAVNDAAVPEYFANGFLAGERTLFRGVHKLRPGHVLLWRDGVVEERAYWAAGDWQSDGNGRGEFWPRFRDAVQSQLMSDVPLGVFLSGGLDSSALVAAMRECGVERIKTFSVGFDEPSANELPYARAVASHFETDHHEIVIRARDYFAQMPDLTWHADGPLRFVGSVPLYAVSRLASESVKVVLAGEGSDELFAGYGRYARGLLNLRAGALYAQLGPQVLRRAIRARVQRLGDRYLASRLKRSFLGSPPGFVGTYLEAFSVFAGEHRAALLPALASVDAYAAERELLDAALYGRNPLEAILRFDQATYLEELLMKQDKMSMAASIESRVPFLDQGLIAWAESIPARDKLRHGRGKHLVRHAARGRVPPAVLQGPKRGFLVPMAEWLRGVGRPWLEEYVPRPDEGPLDGPYVRRLMREHAAGVDHTDRLWLVLAFQVWRRTVTDRAPGQTDLVLEGIVA